MLARSARKLAVLIALSACAARARTPVTPVLAPEPTQTIARPSEAPVVSATDFAQLVRAAAAREQDHGHASTCVLESDAAGLRLVGVSTPALRPLPPPARELDAELARSITINLLTPFGRYGAASGALTLASFTYAPPTREAIALIITDLGIALRGTQADVPARDKLSVVAAAEAAIALQPATVFVSAEASVSSGTLTTLLSTLQSQRLPLALAVNLTAETRLPAPATGAQAALCPNGLPETSEPEGALDVSTLAPALAQLRTRAADCLANVDPRAAAGGKLNLLLRVSATGALENACVDHDEIGDALLRGCILGVARKLQFPAPQPRGSVDFALPLTLLPKFAPAPPLLCAPAT